ncbi:DsbA family protein [Candidatus Pacearchaeota archaeon]|nr:DsbA family protein [Candidatus Pacearchaeota archaeon]
MSEETITIKKEALWKYSTFVLAALLIVMSFMYFNKGISTTGSVMADGKLPGSDAPPVYAQATVDDDPVVGSKDAKVTIIEFSDYQCPFCRKFWTETYQQLKKDYVDTGKVKLVFRDYPLPFHASAEVSAEAANCVREKGGDEAYFKMHDKIFSEGNKLDGGDPLKGPVKGTAQYGAAELKKWAKEIGYEVDSCIGSGKYSDEISKDMSDGSAAGVEGTPAFFINGKLISGAQPYSAFKSAIDSALK